MTPSATVGRRDGAALSGPPLSGSPGPGIRPRLESQELPAGIHYRARAWSDSKRGEEAGECNPFPATSPRRGGHGLVNLTLPAGPPEIERLQFLSEETESTPPGEHHESSRATPGCGPEGRSSGAGGGRAGPIPRPSGGPHHRDRHHDWRRDLRSPWFHRSRSGARRHPVLPSGWNHRPTQRHGSRRGSHGHAQVRRGGTTSSPALSALCGGQCWGGEASSGWSSLRRSTW